MPIPESPVMDSEHSLVRVILTASFPHHDPQTVAETVCATHARLREDATVATHPAALTQRQADDTLTHLRPRRTQQDGSAEQLNSDGLDSLADGVMIRTEMDDHQTNSRTG
ncbi:hypothetical protein QF037_009150 [Streptomyces canus]|uniref:three-helix bundle dimerization domain-containing protein n=1 Tax=Streptomyces canus TaxID=58343 RepID=UPI00278838CF|nr:hypothetical protein [Streptomyces canus]MDQ0604805.1 hypothetical protein [Streptomyces canus]